tara:strand:+ start:27 stop:1112 length:1086 start_codon:yes stop_codon:yes gene_type:complete
MKNKIAIASAFLAASSLSFAEVSLTENISVGGFVDMSYSHTDDDSVADESTNSYTLDQVEVSWYFDFSPVTAQIDIEYEGGDVLVDQGFVTYDLGGGTAITAGRYDSMLGFEAFEPTGMYQYSTAYNTNSQTEIDDLNTEVEVLTGGVLDIGIEGYSDIIKPRTNEGVKLTHESGSNFYGISLQDGGFFGDNRLGGDTQSDIDDAVLSGQGYAVEAAFATDLGNGFNLFVGGLWENADSDVFGEVDSTVYNAYLTYETGAWLFAAEYIMTEHDFEASGDLEIDSFLLMANYSYSDQASITGRISEVDIDDYADATKLTIAHLYAFTDNLALCTELSTVDYDYEGDESGDTLEAGVELLFTF